MGDEVVIAVSEERLKELQADFGGATAGMIQVQILFAKSDKHSMNVQNYTERMIK